MGLVLQLSPPVHRATTTRLLQRYFRDITLPVWSRKYPCRGWQLCRRPWWTRIMRSFQIMFIEGGFLTNPVGLWVHQASTLIRCPETVHRPRWLLTTYVMFCFRTSYQRTSLMYAQTYRVSKKSAVYKHNLFLQCNINSVLVVTRIFVVKRLSHCALVCWQPCWYWRRNGGSWFHGLELLIPCCAQWCVVIIHDP